MLLKRVDKWEAILCVHPLHVLAIGISDRGTSSPMHQSSFSLRPGQSSKGLYFLPSRKQFGKHSWAKVCRRATQLKGFAVVEYCSQRSVNDIFAFPSNVGARRLRKQSNLHSSGVKQQQQISTKLLYHYCYCLLLLTSIHLRSSCTLLLVLSAFSAHIVALRH